MTFEIGDKVRLTGWRWEESDLHGEVVTITGKDEDGYGLFTHGGLLWNVRQGPDADWGGVIVSEDLINDPSHYRQGGIAVHAILDAYGLDKKHYLASATEYILRSGFKGTEESDLRKAVWHLNHYIEQHFGQEQG